MYEVEHFLLPGFPRTHHLPIEPNAQRDDLVVSDEELTLLLNATNVTIEEKIDASNCGITVLNGNPVIRNRTKILNKAYTGSKTPAKMQFSPIWTWYYRNANKFKKLADILGFMPSVYGEWMFAKHTVFYNRLPDLFVVFDVYEAGKGYIASKIARKSLEEAGFSVVPLIAQDIKLTPDILKELRDGDSMFSDEKREGIYIKVSDENYITHRYKMVRPDFKTDDNWNKKAIVKNIIRR
jgi:ATP-dependent RNA circularization protein (DNA/RNA ligase family)